MIRGVIDFVIPVRHHESVSDWGRVQEHLKTTLRSIALQETPNWRAVVVANKGSALPELPPGVEVARVDFELPTMPDPRDGLDAFYDAIRWDKGRRILAGLVHLGELGHVMVVDYDDIISSRLAPLVAENPDDSGWYFDDGYLYSGGMTYEYYPRDFYELCGTSHIVRSDLILGPSFPDLSPEDVKIRLGSHKFIKKTLDISTEPLQRLPFTGTIYRVGHATSNSGSETLFRSIFDIKKMIRRPRTSIRRIQHLRFTVPESFPALNA